ncbi:hypothetical protein BK133_01480 [Paenibacillus sp. FSL H8-0548]|nr:hypothetical protein BK133_01480 [Paenibacillus sp. FSL H8-0548]
MEVRVLSSAPINLTQALKINLILGAFLCFIGNYTFSEPVDNDAAAAVREQITKANGSQRR